MDVHLRDLRYFLAVAEELSFTRAAARLHLSQPALSKQIRQLERSLRVTLLDRDSRGVTLRPAGAALLAEAGRLLESWDQTLRAVADADSHDRRVLRVGLQTGIGRDLYPAAARLFTAGQPGWRISLRMCPWTDPSAGLIDRTSDAAFVWLPAPAGIEHRVIAREPRWVALPAGHRLAAREEVDFAELLDEPFVALPVQTGPLREFWLATAERDGHPARIGAEAATPEETPRPEATPRSMPGPTSPAARCAACPRAASPSPGGTGTGGRRCTPSSRPAWTPPGRERGRSAPRHQPRRGTAGRPVDLVRVHSEPGGGAPEPPAPEPPPVSRHGPRQARRVRPDSGMRRRRPRRSGRTGSGPRQRWPTR